MKDALIKKRITLRDLHKKTGINIGRLSELKMHRDEPTSKEMYKIIMVLGTNIKFAESEEAKKNRAELKIHDDGLDIVLKEISNRGFKKGNGGEGQMGCPVCGKTLYFFVSSDNGHVYGNCLGKDCLSWMQ